MSTLRAQIVMALKTLGEPATSPELAELCEGGTTVAEVTSEIGRMVAAGTLRRIHNPSGRLRYALPGMAEAEADAGDAPDDGVEPEAAAEDASEAAPAEAASNEFVARDETSAAETKPELAPARADASTSKPKQVLAILAAATAPMSNAEIVAASHGTLTSADVSGACSWLRNSGKAVRTGTHNTNATWSLAGATPPPFTGAGEAQGNGEEAAHRIRACAEGARLQGRQRDLGEGAQRAGIQLRHRGGCRGRVPAQLRGRPDLWRAGEGARAGADRARHARCGTGEGR